MVKELATYRVERLSLDGVDVFALDGGMSAEYAVQEALASLSGGVAHTWAVQAPGLGPNPVRASERFLRQSVRATIAAYDSLGRTSFDTVVLGTGVSSASYVAHLLEAPFLPLHFLASARSIAETQRTLDGAADDGYQSYATLAYDESMPTMAVAWIKLLSLPDEYVQFLARYGVRRVVLLGTRGPSPHLARRPVSDTALRTIAPRQVLVTWPDAGSQYDDTWLRRTINDLPDVELESPAFQIADWESGLGEEQIEGVLGDLRKAGLETWLLTADHYQAAYDLATFAHATVLESTSVRAAQLVLNPYLVTHPFAEAVNGSLPLLYWQLDPLDVTLDRLENVGSAATGMPVSDLRRLPVVVNATRNIGGADHASALADALRARGFANTTTLDTSADELFGDRVDTPFWRAFDAVAVARQRGLTVENPPDALARLDRAIKRLPAVRLQTALRE